MVTIILMTALLILIAALAVEIGIASWNIRRAGRYQRQLVFKTDQEISLTGKFRVLDKYATDISWLLKFLYARYNNFSDIGKEIEAGIPANETTPILELNKNFNDLKRANKIIKTTVSAAEKFEKFQGSIASQITSILQDFEDDEEGELSDVGGGESESKEISPENDGDKNGGNQNFGQYENSCSEGKTREGQEQK